MFHAYKEFWKRYTDFTGKSTRSEYWYVFLLNCLIRFTLLAIIGIGYFVIFSQVPWDLLEQGYDLAPSEIMAPGMILGLMMIFLVGFLLFAYNVAIFVPSLALPVRRLRDAGLPWQLIFIAFVPLLGLIALIILFCQPTVTERKVEEDPQT